MRSTVFIIITTIATSTTIITITTIATITFYIYILLDFFLYFQVVLFMNFNEQARWTLGKTPRLDPVGPGPSFLLIPG